MAPLVVRAILLISLLLGIGGCAAGDGRSNGSAAKEAPAAPTDLQATAISSSRIDLSWTDSDSRETGFVLERSLDTDFAIVAEIEIEANQEAYSDTGLSAETHYFYRIKAVNGRGPSAYSNYTDARTPVDNAAQASFCTTLPLASQDTITVNPSQAGELQSIVANAAVGTTILLADGTYTLDGGYLWMSRANVSLRSVSGNRDDVVLDGNYTTSEIITVAASDITIADITIQRARTHAIHVVSTDQGDTLNTRIHNVRVVDPGQQGIKINPHAAKTQFTDFGTIACCEIVLTDQGRPKIWEINGSCYTGGIDAHASRGWTIRDNRIEGFWCENGISEHAIHFWRGCRDTLVERNTIINCARGIGFGLVEDTSPARTFDDLPLCNGSIHAGHYDGVVRNNTVFANLNALFDSESGFDCGICMAQACGAKIVHNSVASTRAPFASIEWRFGKSRVEITNNLVTHNLMRREEAEETRAGNLENAPLALFVDGTGGDLHLDLAADAAIDQGVDAAALCSEDMDGDERDDAPDIGADEV